MYKKFYVILLSIIFISLFIITGVVIIVDPFFQYHKPLINIKIEDERYQNPGMLKNFDYNAILTGSSMVENFKESWFENEKVLKVPMSGGYSKDFDYIFKLAFDNRKIDTVYYGIDIFNILYKNPNSTRSEIPSYLYDDNIFNNIRYVFNRDVFNKYIFPNVKRNINKEYFNNDLAYNWNAQNVFSKNEVLKVYSRPEKSIEKAESFLTNYEDNMNNIVKYIEMNPNTKFKIFFPPYSILFYDYKIRKGYDKDIILATKKVMEDLLKYSNVELYYFQNNKDIITNLDNYKDYTHYNENINYYMYECMCKTDKHRINLDNYLNELEIMSNLIFNYDYDEIFK